VSEVIEQLELNWTFFFHFFLFSFLYFALTHIFFKPFLGLIRIRRKETVEHRDEAERILIDTQKSLEQYLSILADEREKARQEFERVLLLTRKEEAEIFDQARKRAKRLIETSFESVEYQRIELKSQLSKEIDILTTDLVNKLIVSGA